MKVLMVASVIAFEVGTFGVANADEALRREATALFGQLKASTEAPSPQVELGRALFWDTRLSADGKTACASCHPARDWGADRRRFSPDARGALTSRHSPTIFNSVSQPMLRWLGDRKNAADQAESSITGSMGFASKDAGVAKLAELEYMPNFRAAFPQDAQPLSSANYARALASYEATLTTPAPFDRFLAGDDSALTEPQKAGLKTFVSTGCAGCHNGVNLGGATLQKFGLTKDYWLETGSEKPDPGRFALTKKEEDRYVFRVPMLRNVAKTAPYFHDGSVERLDRAVRVMASVQLGRTLDDAAVTSIVSFLESLTGDVPSNYAPPGRRPEM
jgi:cytochrome c peroxidase